MFKQILCCFLCIPVVAFSQNVFIPDSTFKNYLINNSAINTNGDSAIQVIEANSFTGTIYVSGLPIKDLRGIESFTSMTELWCGGLDSLVILDLSNNSALIKLSCNLSISKISSLHESKLLFLNQNIGQEKYQTE